MPIVSLHNHDYIFGIRDVLRLFYGPEQEVKDNFIITGHEDSTHIRSERRADGRIETSVEGKNISILSDDSVCDDNMLKREIKRQLYYVLATINKMSYPWGSLTGIRPTYVAGQAIEKLGETQAKSYLEEFYFVSQEKADLAVQTYLAEEKLLDSFPEEDLAIYIGIPFCPTRCSYCSFSTNEGIGRPDAEKDLYVDTLIEELRLVWTNVAFRQKLKGSVRALYVGGGTPTALSATQLQRLFTALDSLDIPWAEACERTLEAGRPDTIDREKLEVIRLAGFRRISINPQSMKDETLRKIGRSHQSKDILDSFSLARALGFDNINMDLIAGLSGETIDDFNYSLERILSLEPDSVTIHNLAVKRSSRMHRRLVEDRLIRKRSGHTDKSDDDLYRPDEEVAGMLRDGRTILEDKGYLPYYLYRSKDGMGSLENTAFARLGKACLYNVAMMADTRSILSFGAGSISKRILGSRLERSPNVKNIAEYRERIIEMAGRKLELWNRAKE